jgi:hypothetical protein
MKNFLFFLDFGFGYLRVWPKPCLVAHRSYLVLRGAKKVHKSMKKIFEIRQRGI